MRDPDIRKILIDYLCSKFTGRPNTMLVEELGVLQGDKRIDVAVINGSLYGYEIKSDYDTLARLDDQLEAYNKVFDYITLVVGSKHLSKVKEHLPEWYGLAVVKETNGQHKIKTLRSAKRNSLIEADSLVQLLWKDEALNALREINSHKNLSKANRATIWSRLVEKVSLKKLRSIIRKTLQSRLYWREPKHAHRLQILG